jgi:hypothetical protein
MTAKSAIIADQTITADYVMPTTTLWNGAF